MDWSLLEELERADESVLARVDVVQPMLWAVMVSLAAVWRSLGVSPSAVVGHSQGEIAAACVAGVLSLEDGARVVAVRSRLLAGLSGGGAMVAVALSEVAVRARLVAGLSVAAVNGPAAVVVSGPVVVLEGFVQGCVGDGVQVRWLPVDYASHSAQVDVVRSELVAGLAGIEPGVGEVAFFSSVTGGWVGGGELGAGYWFENLRSTVRFEFATRELLGQGWSVFVEVGPHPVLLAAVRETFDDVVDEGVVDRGVVTVGSLRRDGGGWGDFLGNVGRVWGCGVGVVWGGLFEVGGVRRVGLPGYAFQRRRFWSEGGGGGGVGVVAAGLQNA
ncbi:acyltransferase domain-containing protein, partial [Nocardia sp. NPDC048505]|uniref:acyltransferase domain-containing protein n=1 Tax=Nocardia sp. NPDC048505 TaxID=3155756 RepID=UPI0033EC25E2